MKLPRGSVMSALSRVRCWFTPLQKKSPQFTQILFPIPSLSAAQQAKDERKNKVLWAQHLHWIGQEVVTLQHTSPRLLIWGPSGNQQVTHDRCWAELENEQVALKNKMSPGIYKSLSLSKPRQKCPASLLPRVWFGFWGQFRVNQRSILTFRWTPCTDMVAQTEELSEKDFTLPPPAKSIPGDSHLQDCFRNLCPDPQ